MPPDEEERLQRLHAYRILDTAPEEAFEDVALLAAQVCGTPVALVNLVDRHRQWFKARVGMDDQERARDTAFCAYAILEPGLVEVPDARTDPRFRDNPFVLSDPPVRFYAAAPLRDQAGASALGTVCAFGPEPQELTPGQREALAALGRFVVNHLRLRAAHIRLQETLMALDRSAPVDAQVRRQVTNRLGHNLATPLTPLRLQLHLLRPHVTDEPGRKALASIERNVDRLSEAVADVVAFTSGRGAARATSGSRAEA